MKKYTIEIDDATETLLLSGVFRLQKDNGVIDMTTADYLEYLIQADAVQTTVDKYLATSKITVSEVKEPEPFKQFHKLAGIGKAKPEVRVDYSQDILAWVDTKVVMYNNAQSVRTPIVLHDYQRRLLVQLATGRSTLIVQGRQMGVSMCLDLFVLWCADTDMDKCHSIICTHNSSQHRAHQSRIMDVAATSKLSDITITPNVAFDKGAFAVNGSTFKYASFDKLRSNKLEVGNDVIIFDNADHFNMRDFTGEYLRMLEFSRPRQIIITCNRVTINMGALTAIIKDRALGDCYDIVQLPSTLNPANTRERMAERRRQMPSGMGFVEEFMATIDYHGILAPPKKADYDIWQ